MRIVITGGSGRLGQYVVRELFTHNHAVAALDAIKPRECLCPTYTVDLTKFDSLLEHLNNADALVHLARVRFPYTVNGYNVAEQKWEFADVRGDAERLPADHVDVEQRIIEPVLQMLLSLGDGVERSDDFVSVALDDGLQIERNE